MVKKCASLFVSTAIAVFPIITTAAVTPKVPAGCVQITHALSFNKTDAATGGDVSTLQRFLAKDKSLYPSAKITGKYDIATLLAVFRWQEKNGLILPDDPGRVGGGIVGPKTLTAFKRVCAGKPAVVSQKDTLVPNDDSGSAPFTVALAYMVNRSGSCDAGTYTLSFGDENLTGSSSLSIPYEARVCNPYRQESTHTYTETGTYVATLYDNDNKVIDAAKITVTK